jgi:hypothetical protein
VVRRFSFLIAILAGGCQAQFVDLRPQSERATDGGADDLSAAEDLKPAPPDLVGIDFTGVDFWGVDLTEPPPPDLATGPETTIASGPFMGRAGHSAAGTASLVTKSDGSEELRFGSDFTVTGVPGPVVVLTMRDAIGTSIDPSQGDLELGTLKSTSGAQSYPLPNGDLGRRRAWVFCKPFGVEVGKALMAP